MIDLRSDNTAAACPQVMAALAAVNRGRESSYGDDTVMEQLRRRIRVVFDHAAAEIFPTVTGTAANALALASVSPPWGAVLCHESAHIANHEAGATTHLSGGAVMRLLPGAHGRIDPGALGDVLEATWWGDAHQSQPSVLSVVCPTDLGAVPTPDEIRVLADIAAGRGLRCHLDGARLANALAHLHCGPGELTWRSGVDILSLGLTKNGGMNADAIVCFDPGVAEEVRYRLKRAGHVPSKMRFLAAQILAMLDEGLWLRCAGHANAMASRLAEGLAAGGLPPSHPVQANLVFAPIDGGQAARIRDRGVEFFELVPGVARFVTSWQTDPDEIDSAVERILTAL